MSYWSLASTIAAWLGPIYQIYRSSLDDPGLRWITVPGSLVISGQNPPFSRTKALTV